MNRLEQAQSKLNRLRAEKEETQKLIRQQHELNPFRTTKTLSGALIFIKK